MSNVPSSSVLESAHDHASDGAGHRRSARPHSRTRRSLRSAIVWLRRPGALQEWLSAGAVIVVLQAFLFWEYYSGVMAPPWDFFGAYNAEAFAWWRDGSFFEPTQWMPYQWGGYPAGASLQNSAWYLPVGIAESLAPFTIHAASALQALHVGLGAFGLYWLARTWGQGRAPALFGLVAYFFAVGFFSNAQHVDIVRAFAWVPWLLLCVSPQWHWRRAWGIPVAALVFWQAAISSYPGVLALLVYGILAWVCVAQFSLRPRFRDYLVPLSAAALGAGLLSIVKFLPAFLTRGIGGSTGTTTDVFDLGVLGTLFFQYDLGFLPNDVTMRSFFVVAPVLPLMVAARWRDPLVRVAVALLGTGVIFGLPWPWSPLIESLPGLGLSRFRMADSRALIVVACVLIAVSGLNALLARSRSVAGGLSPASPPARLYVILAAIPCAAMVIALTVGFPTAAWMGPWWLLTFSSIAVGGLLWMTHSRPVHGEQNFTGALVAVLVLLAGFSGLDWAHANSRPWMADRVGVEMGHWGQTSGGLIFSRLDPGELEQRPARTSLPADAYPGLERVESWSNSYYSGVPSIGGNANLVGAPAFTAIHDSVLPGSEVRDDALAFWSAPGIVMESGGTGLPTSHGVDSCVTSGVCGESLVSTPVDYDLGFWSYDVVTSRDTTVVFNEAYYPGLTLSACSTSAPTTCLDLSVKMADSGAASVDLSAGEWELVLTYETPGQRVGWIAFWAGVLVTGMGALVVGIARRRGRDGTVAGSGSPVRPADPSHIRPADSRGSTIGDQAP